MPSVQLPDHAVRDYLQTFHLACVFITAGALQDHRVRRERQR
jgi:hypothetical protein